LKAKSRFSVGEFPLDPCQFHHITLIKNPIQHLLLFAMSHQTRPLRQNNRNGSKHLLQAIRPEWSFPKKNGKSNLRSDPSFPSAIRNIDCQTPVTT